MLYLLFLLILLILLFVVVDVFVVYFFLIPSIVVALVFLCILLFCRLSALCCFCCYCALGPYNHLLSLLCIFCCCYLSCQLTIYSLFNSFHWSCSSFSMYFTFLLVVGTLLFMLPLCIEAFLSVCRHCSVPI